MSRKITCCGLQSYFVDIKPKKDFKGSLEQISEFFSAMSISHSSENLIRVVVVGCDLSEMISDIERSVGQSGYISRVEIGSEVVVYDYIPES